MAEAGKWLPSIVASSRHVGKLPEELGPLSCVDWIPVDRLAAVVVELLGNSSSSTSAAGLDGESEGAGDVPVYHGVNPRITTWESLLPALKEGLGIEEVVFC